MTERMRVIGWLSASMKTVQQQGAVSRVANRVHAFGKHRGASTENAAVNFEAVRSHWRPGPRELLLVFGP